MQTPEEGEDIKRNEAALRYAEAGRYARGIQTDTTADIQRAAETQIQGDMEALAIDAAAKKKAMKKAVADAIIQNKTFILEDEAFDIMSILRGNGLKYYRVRTDFPLNPGNYKFKTRQDYIIVTNDQPKNYLFRVKCSEVVRDSGGNQKCISGNNKIIGLTFQNGESSFYTEDEEGNKVLVEVFEAYIVPIEETEEFIRKKLEKKWWDFGGGRLKNSKKHKSKKNRKQQKSKKQRR